MSAISFHCKLQNVPDPTPEFLIMKLLKRLKHTADTRLPITKTILHNIIQIIPIMCTNDFETTFSLLRFPWPFTDF